MVSTVVRKSLEPKVFQVKGEGEEDALLGSKCKKCGGVFFPPREWCAACYEPTCETIVLSGEGILESFALMERKQAYSVVEPPFVIGEVLLPEGVHVYTTINLRSEVSSEEAKVYSTIDGDNFISLKVGQRARLSPVVIRWDEEGNEIVAYNFDIVKEG